MNRTQYKPAFCHHVTCNRAVNAAGNEQRCTSCGADRHSVCAGNLLAIQVCSVTYFNGKRNLGFVNVNTHGRISFKNQMPEFAVDPVRIHKIVLVRTAGKNLEAEIRIFFNLFVHKHICRAAYTLPILINGKRGTDGVNAEHAGEP